MVAPNTDVEGSSAAELVGRAEVLDDLISRLRSARRGRPEFVVLTGAAGSGKSSVLRYFLQYCRSQTRGVQLLTAAGDTWEAQFPLGGYSQLMRAVQLRTIKDDDAARLSEHSGSFEPPQIANFASTFASHLEALQAHGVVVVAIDDAQALDPETLRILTFVMRRVVNKRIMFVLTLNPDATVLAGASMPVSAIDYLLSQHVSVIPLAPLTVVQIQDLGRKITGTDMSEIAARRLHQHTGGNPHEAVELLREMPAETWRSRFVTLPPSARVRTRVRMILAEGSPEVVALAETAAVLFSPSTDTFWGKRSVRMSDLRAILHRTVGMEEPGFLRALDEAHRSGLLSSTIDSAHAIVQFESEGVAGAVYQQILPSRRLELHRLSAEVTQDENQHFAHRTFATTGPDESLAQELVEFAQRQSRSGQWQNASSALFSASRLSPDVRLSDARLLQAVDAVVGSGNISRAQLWISTVEALDPSPLRSSTLGYLSTASGQNDHAQNQLEMAWKTSNPEHEPEQAAQVATRLVLHSLASWDGHAMTSWAERAMSLTGSGTPAHIESQAIYGLGLYAQGRVTDARAAYSSAIEVANEDAQFQRLQMGSAWLSLRLDDAETAQVNFQSAASTDHRGGSMRISLWAEAWLARTHLVLGNWDAAASTIEHATDRLNASRMLLIRPLLYWTAAELWSMRGDWERARYYVSQAAVQPGTYRVMQVPAILARARLHEARADYEGAVAVLEPLSEIDAWTADSVSFWPWQDTYVNALVMTDQLDRAEEFLTDFEAIPREVRVPSDIARMSWARGRLVAAQGDPDTAREHFEAALTALEGLNRPYLRARVSFAYGQSMRRAGKRRLAATVLRSARDLYDSLGAQTYVERCDREILATGLEPGAVSLAATGQAQAQAADPNTQLTAQERAVAELVATGATNKEVARSLFLAEKTVQYHLTRLYRKMGVRSRSELAAVFRISE